MDRGPALVDLPYSHHDVSSVLYGHDVGTGLGRGRMDAVVVCWLPISSHPPNSFCRQAQSHPVRIPSAQEEKGLLGRNGHPAYILIPIAHLTAAFGCAQGWNADIIDKSPWIRLDLETVEKVLGISTAGRGDQMEWVAQYRVCSPLWPLECAR